jgi:hypothetical protein
MSVSPSSSSSPNTHASCRQHDCEQFCLRIRIYTYIINILYEHNLKTGTQLARAAQSSLKIPREVRMQDTLQWPASSAVAFKCGWGRGLLRAQVCAGAAEGCDECIPNDTSCKIVTSLSLLAPRTSCVVPVTPVGSAAWAGAGASR